jgi:hypothetical protein
MASRVVEDLLAGDEGELVGGLEVEEGFHLLECWLRESEGSD